MRGLSRLARLALPLRRHGYLSRTAPRGRLCPEAATLSPRRRARIWQHMRSGAVTTFPGEQQSARDASRGPVSGKGAVSPLRLDVLATVPMGQSAEAPLGVVRLPQSAGAALSRRLVWTAGSRPARARHRARSGPLHPRESNGDRPRSRQVKAAGAGDRPGAPSIAGVARPAPDAGDAHRSLRARDWSALDAEASARRVRCSVALRYELRAPGLGLTGSIVGSLCKGHSADV
jgi:hypothetical protein